MVYGAGTLHRSSRAQERAEGRPPVEGPAPEALFNKLVAAGGCSDCAVVTYSVYTPAMSMGRIKFTEWLPAGAVAALAAHHPTTANHT